MDFKNFKKVGVTRTHTIFEHPEGHTIHVNHAKLKPGLKKEMRGIPVQELAEGTPEGVQAEEPSMWDKFKGLMGTDLGTGGPSPEEVARAGSVDAAMGVSPEQMQPMPVAAPVNEPQNFQLTPNASQPVTSTADKMGLGSQMEAMARGVEGQKTGLMAEAEAKAQQGRAEAGAIEKGMIDLAQVQNDFQARTKELTDERSALMSDFQKGHIDPKAYLGRMDTGQKVSTAIGLILGGVGAGLAGGENVVLKMLNQQIDRDIDAQKAEVGKRATLLSANLQEFGLMKDAADMTRINMMDMLKGKLQQAAATATSPLAKAQAMQAIGVIDQQTAPVLAQLAMKKAVLGNKNIDPSTAIRFVVDPADRDKAFKEAGSRQQLGETVKLVDKSYDDLSQIGAIGANLPFSKSSARMNALNAGLVSLASKAIKGNPSEDEAKRQILPYLVRSTDTLPQVEEKRKGLQQFLTLNREPTPVLDSYGIKVPEPVRVRRNINIPPGYKKGK